MVQYLKGVHIGEFTTSTMKEISDHIDKLQAKNPDHCPPTETLPRIPIDPCPEQCLKCEQCQESISWD